MEEWISIPLPEPVRDFCGVFCSSAKYGVVMQKCLPPREFSPPYCCCVRARQSPRQPILDTDLALLQGCVLGAFRHDQPTLGPKLSVPWSPGHWLQRKVAEFLLAT